MKLTRFALPLLLVALLSACILVKDFGKVWEESKPDSCVTKIAQSLYYAEFNRAPDEEKLDDLARAYSLEGKHYLLLKKDVGDEGGRLYRFRVINGIFERYRLLPTMRTSFEEEYPDAPVGLKRDTVTLDTLDADTLALLAKVSSDDKYWEIADKILYNPLRNPACRFEDRDLATIDDAPKRPSRKKPNADTQ